MGEMNSPVLLI